MRLPRDPVYLKGVLGNLLPHALQPGAGQCELVFLKNPLQWPVIRIDGELREAMKIERAFGDYPDNGEAF